MASLSPKSPEGHSAWDYAQTFVDLLHGIKQAVEDSRGNDPITRRLPFNIQCDATGYGAAEFRIPRGVNWVLGGISFTASATGNVATYVNEESGSTLIKVNTSALIVSDYFEESDELTSDDGILLIVARSQTASQVVSGNIRLRQYESNKSEPKDATG